MRTGEELPELLSAIARAVSDSLAFRTVVINLYRREWDDFVVTTVYGSDEAREALLGQVRQVSDWDAAARRALPAARRVPPPLRRVRLVGSPRLVTRPTSPVSDDPNAWHPDDALFVPMRGSRRHAARDPLGRRADLRPQAERRRDRRPRRRLRARGARGRRPRRSRARAKANSEALEHLLAVSARLNESHDTHELLQHVRRRSRRRSASRRSPCSC